MSPSTPSSLSVLAVYLVEISYLGRKANACALFSAFWILSSRDTELVHDNPFTDFDVSAISSLELLYG